MSEVTPNENPYQAPKSAAPGQLQLPADRDYLVQGDVIYCRSVVELPKVCIRYGETENLQPRTMKLRTMSGISILVSIPAAVIFLLLPMLLFMSVDVTVDSWWKTLLFAAGVAGFIAFVFWIWRRGQHEVTVTWYLSQRYLKWNGIVKWVVRAIIFTGICSMGVSMMMSQTGHPPATLIISVFVAIVVSMGFNPETKLELRGKRNGLFYLKGYSRKFRNMVKALTGTGSE